MHVGGGGGGVCGKQIFAVSFACACVFAAPRAKTKPKNEGNVYYLPSPSAFSAVVSLSLLQLGGGSGTGE